MRQPEAAPASSRPHVSASCSRPPPSTRTKYAVAAASVVLAGARKVAMPAPTSPGPDRVATAGPVGVPEWTVTVGAATGDALAKRSTMALSV